MAKQELQRDTTGIPRSSSPVPFVLPLVVFLMIASRYPDFASEEEPRLILTTTYWYVGMIAVQVVLAAGLLVYFRKTYQQHFSSPYLVPVCCSGGNRRRNLDRCLQPSNRAKDPRGDGI